MKDIIKILTDNHLKIRDKFLSKDKIVIFVLFCYGIERLNYLPNKIFLNYRNSKF